jgi:hypothetical protein
MTFKKDPRRKPAFPRAGINVTSAGAGTVFYGTLASIRRTGGRLAAFSAGQKNAMSSSFLAAELSNLQSTTWANLTNADLRHFRLTTLLAREWALVAALDREQREPFAAALSGLLPASRGWSLMRTLDQRDWRRVWDNLTLADLYVLGRRCIESPAQPSWESPVTLALAALGDGEGDRVQLLGRTLSERFENSVPRLDVLAPYEEYERYLFPSRIAERSAEFKLYLARYWDSRALPASAMGAVAEPAVLETLQRAGLRSVYDWRAVLNSYHSISGDVLDQLLEDRQ